MDDLLDAVSVQDLGHALARLGSIFGLTHLTILDGSRLLGSSESFVIYPAQTQEAEQALQRSITLPVLKHVRASEYPLTFDELQQVLAQRGGDFAGFNPSGRHQAKGMLSCAPARGKLFWLLKFAGGDESAVSGLTRALLHVAGELAYWRLEELSQATTAMTPLTSRERQVMRLLSWGKTDAEAAQELGISPRTVRFHVDNAKRKLGVASRAQAIVLSLRGRQASVLNEDHQVEGWLVERQEAFE
jgi:DNA-binding CsgD family transcriptional regulator